jgi:integrase
MIERRKFPQIYEFEHPKNGRYWLVSARSKRWNMNERKTFPTKTLAEQYADSIDEKLRKFGAQPEIPKEKILLAERYQGLTDKLSPLGQSVEYAVEHYQKHVAQEMVKQAKPFIRDLVDEWEKFKKTDTTLSPKFLVDIHSYARFIKRIWGDLKPDEPKKNQIDLLIRGLKISNNTRRAYLRYIRMFFSWVKDEGHILHDPTAGIKFKADDFNGDFYTPDETAKLFRHIAEHNKPLIGYYALLTFAGLRPSEGARVQWSDINLKTHQVRVRKGKTNARHIKLHSVAEEWIKIHRENTPKDDPFVQLIALPNREKEIRQAVFPGKWIQDGLRHGFATYYVHLVKDVPATSFYMGNSVGIVNRHYARTVPEDELKAFWGLTPAKVLAEAPHS